MTIEWWQWQASRPYAMEWLCCPWTSTSLTYSCTRGLWYRNTCDTLQRWPHRWWQRVNVHPIKDTPSRWSPPTSQQNTEGVLRPAVSCSSTPCMTRRKGLFGMDSTQTTPRLLCYGNCFKTPKRTELCPPDDEFRSYVSKWHTSLDRADQHSDFFMCPLIWKHR